MRKWWWSDGGVSGEVGVSGGYDGLGIVNPLPVSLIDDNTEKTLSNSYGINKIILRTLEIKKDWIYIFIKCINTNWITI